MKIIKKVLILISVLLMLVSCTKKVDYASYISGKTFYNTVDEFDNIDHSKIWFGTDKSFVMQDNFFDGTYEISGKWAIENNVCTLTVDKTGVGAYETIKFEIKDEDTIILKTALAGSKFEDTFTTTEVKGNGNNNTSNDNNTTNNNTTNNNTTNNNNNNTSNNNSNNNNNTSNNNTSNNSNNNNTKKDNYINATFYSCTGESTFELRSDGSATFLDKNDYSVAEGNGKYVIDGDYITIKDFAPTNPFGQNIKLKKHAENTYILETNLGISVSGDYFVKGGTKCPIQAQETIYENIYHNTTWIHEAMEDVSDQFLPKIEFFNIQGMGYSFVFTENVYAGLVEIIGSYEASDRYIICTVEDNSQLKGFAGEGLEYIEFEVIDGKTIELLTDITMSKKGDRFIIE